MIVQLSAVTIFLVVFW